MRIRMSKAALLSAAMVLGAATQAQAQEASGDERQVTTAEDLVVLGNIQYRNRVEGAPPVLEYDTEYFQRFEPLTVGDALKRVPSVAFLSDVLESDGVRLRGLDPAYTQILINGEQVPGSGDSSGAFGNGADGSFFVDRIPAELIDRVEIVRSQSANRSGDAVAGAINIVLRDAYNLDGGYIRGGVMHWQNDEHWGETLGGVWGGEVGGGRLLIGANMQDRHNPKDKLSLRYEEPGGLLTDIEDQTDVRDGTDYSANFSYQRDIGPGELELSGFYVHTDRFADEDSIEYANVPEDDTLTQDDLRDAANIAAVNANSVDTDQDSYSLNGRYRFNMAGGRTRIGVGYARFENSEFEFEDEAAYEFGLANLDEYESEITATDLTDTETSLRLEHERQLGEGLTLEFGVHFQNKERENLVRAADAGFDPGDPEIAGGLPFDGSLVDRGDLEAVDGGDNTIERRRIDPYVMLTGDMGAIDWEAGLRYETTEVTVDDRTEGTSDENSYEVLLPSAHVSWNVTENDRFLFSVARTMRNPSFTFLSPATLEGELSDNDFIGDPNLKPETAWGLDAGYERRLGRTGIFGVNFFYRDVSDLIELYNTGAPSDAYCGDFEDDTGFTCDDVADGVPGAADDYDPDSFVYSARNTGDGSVWGIEFDLSTSLGVIGLEDTGVFLNYSWLDSEVEDEVGERRFNSQAESIFNIGFIQDLPSLNSSFGVTYRDQGSAFSRVVGEETRTEYGADLEMFVEHRFGENFTIRLTGSNLLDESKDEFFDKFDNLADQLDRDYDEYEVESETAGPVFQLVGRYAF
jgi:outer membrane receptor protein involved in Fe transport